MVMECAVNQLSSIKAQLRTNAEIVGFQIFYEIKFFFQVRKEIATAIGYQLSLVRAREQFLMRNLETILDSKERILCEQQEQLNQAIGACQQSMENAIRENHENPILPGLLFRYVFIYFDFNLRNN